MLKLWNLAKLIGSMANPKPTILRFGIDVSHHQGRIDWQTVATQNNPKVDFAIIKTSTGIGSKDPRALYNATEAKKNGIKVGYYHYCSLNDKNEIDDAGAEARWFIKVIQTLPTPDLPLVLDIEDQNPHIHLEDQEVSNFIITFFKTLEDNGYNNYVLYSYAPFLDEHLPSNHSLGGIRLWLAQYRQKITQYPRGWTKHWLWQYSAKGRLKGISTDVDLNIFPT